MEAVFFWLWVILIALFEHSPLMVTVGVIVLYVVFKFFPTIVQSVLDRRIQNKKYATILKDATPKINGVDLEKHQTKLLRLEEIYKTDIAPHKVVLENNVGTAINICPKCGGYMKIVKGWKGPFLGCSNYPNCRSYRKYSEIFDIKV